jgi:excisionase family DNA binding protein
MNSVDITDYLLGLQETAKLMGCSTVTVRRMVRRGDLPVTKLPGSRLVKFRRTSLLDLINKCERRLGGQKGAA